ncbi:MAG TPA: hypothetical protein VHA15_01305 [Burkholderiales bacterium]|jgi:hypothetical protein|nr:hypothetical protein [Burkholderiales bacterium]
MGRFTPLQVAFLAFGCSLIAAGLGLDHIARAWENYRYPNAVYWHQLRVVPAVNQSIVVPGENLLVVKDADARLTLFRREPDKVTPDSLIRELCRRDGCVRSAVTPSDPDTAVATYRLKGASMQIMLMRLDEGALWIEYKGPPEALRHFDALVRSVAGQLAERRAAASAGAD